MNLDDAIDTIYADFEEVGYDRQKLENVMKEIHEGHAFIKSLYRDLNFLDSMKKDKKFNDYITEDGRGWLTSHRFPITLEILNREKVPGEEVAIKQMGGKKSPVVVYYALCPELENFVSLINWINSKSSLNSYKQILELIKSNQTDKVLQFSDKCGIRLPNEIHPGHDRDAKMITKETFESLYDWKFAHYLFDDGMAALSHNSPVNYRKLYLDEYEMEKSIVDIRTTIGRITSIVSNKIKVSVPCLFGKPYDVEFFIHGKLPREQISLGQLYFLQIFNKTTTENIVKEIRKIEPASTYDLLGMFLAISCYLLYLGTSRLKILNDVFYEKLFIHYYRQISRFCFGHEDELESIQNSNYKLIQLGYTSAFTKWIGRDLHYLPPMLRQFLASLTDPRLRDYIMLEFDKSLSEGKFKCFDRVPYDERGMRMFSSIQLAQFNKVYSYVYFLLEEKKFLLGMNKGAFYHKREEEFVMIKNLIGYDFKAVN